MLWKKMDFLIIYTSFKTELTKLKIIKGYINREFLKNEKKKKDKKELLLLIVFAY